jgi:hypothetical protein
MTNILALEMFIARHEHGRVREQLVKVAREKCG